MAQRTKLIWLIRQWPFLARLALWTSSFPVPNRRSLRRRVRGSGKKTTALLFVACFPVVKSLKTAGVQVCSRLFAFTYPERFEANAAGFPVARQGIFSSPPLLPSRDHPTFLADFTAFGGDSGGPVFVSRDEDKTPIIVRIIIGRHFVDEIIKSDQEERKNRHPMGIGIIRHSRYIRDTIDLATVAK